MALYNPVYVTNAEVITNTTNSKLAAEPTTLIDKLIVKAQIILDWYIGDIEPYDAAQDFKFPNSDNVVPKNVKQSTIYIIEAIYEELKQAREWVKSEAWDGYSVSYVENIASSDYEYVTQPAKDLLTEYWLWNSGRAAFSLNY